MEVGLLAVMLLKDPGLDTGLDLTLESQGEKTIKPLLYHSHRSNGWIK